MRGYWINGAGQQPDPVSLLNNDVTIGLPAVCAGNKIDNSLSARCSSAIDLSSLSFSTAKLLPKYPAGYRRSTMYYQIADYVPTQFLPSGWKGYSTSYNKLNTDDYKVEFTNDNDDTITTAQAYTIKCKIVKFYETFKSDLDSIDALYTDIQDFKNYYLLNYEDILELPAFNNTIGIQSSLSTSASATMKQNTKYVAIQQAASENLNVGSLFFPRQWVKNIKSFEDLNWVCTTDVSTAPTSNFLVSSYHIKSDSTSKRTDLVNNSIPFFLSFCSDGGLRWSTSTETGSLLIKDFALTNLLPGGDLNANAKNYGYKQSPELNIFTQLPYIAPNQVRAFGDGQHSLDNTLVDNFTYNNRTFAKDDPLRYCFIDTNNLTTSARFQINAVYWVITYIDNDIQTLSVNTRIRDHFYGHIVTNEFN